MDSQEEQFEGVLAALSRIDWSLAGGAIHQPIRMNVPTWDRYLGQADREPLQSILGSRNATRTDLITRGQVIELAQDASTNDGRERLLVATLAWGKGMRNNRMFPAFVRLLQDERLDEALASSAESARDGRPADAYRAWQTSGVRGLREPFFTKWLWAASHIGKYAFTVERPRPLVLDGRVWRTLGAEEHPWSSVVAAGGSRSRRTRYEAYARDCRRWADRLGVEAEQVEWVLFMSNGPISGDRLKKLLH